MEEQINKIRKKYREMWTNIESERTRKRSKKSGQEAQAVRNPDNDEIVVNTKKIKRVTLKY